MYGTRRKLRVRILALKDAGSAGIAPPSMEGNELRLAPPGQRQEKKIMTWSCLCRTHGICASKPRFCLEIASQMSDPKAAEKMRADAAEYPARAIQLEAGEGAFAPAQGLGQRAVGALVDVWSPEGWIAHQGVGYIGAPGGIEPPFLP